MVTEEAVSKGDIYLVSLNPSRGSEIRKTRPCVVVSPDESSAHLRILIAAPLATGGYPYPFRFRCRFDDRDGRVVVDRVVAVD